MALAITVLALAPSREVDAAALAAPRPTSPRFALSFVHGAICWNNHHHVFRLVPRVRGAVLRANLNLPFWLSLIPFPTAWMDGHGGAPLCADRATRGGLGLHRPTGWPRAPARCGQKRHPFTPSWGTSAYRPRWAWKKDAISPNASLLSGTLSSNWYCAWDSPS